MIRSIFCFELVAMLMLSSGQAAVLLDSVWLSVVHTRLATEHSLPMVSDTIV